MLDPVIHTTIQDVRSVEEKDLKDKVSTVSSIAERPQGLLLHGSSARGQLAPLFFGFWSHKAHIRLIQHFLTERCFFLKHSLVVVVTSVNRMNIRFS